MDKVSLGTILLLTFLVGYLFTQLPVTDETPSLESSIDLNQDAFHGGEYLRLVYIGSPSCSFSNSSVNHTNVRRLNDELRSKSEKAGLSYLSTGVSGSSEAQTGAEYLAETGPYDEIITGANVYNQGLEKYIWTKDSVSMETPKILVITTEYLLIPFADGGINDIQRQDSLLFSATGKNEIDQLSSVMTDDAEDTWDELLNGRLSLN